ncbi:MAG: HDIG domain-containing protein [Elusimicrobia bacterium]|nr:HDIG domain-containing protein [Elusimicrobiota bacterium]
MINLIKKTIKKPVKRILQWTEKTTTSTRVKFTPEVLNKNVHIPTFVIAIFIYISLILTVSFELKLSLSNIFGITIFLAVVMVLAIIYLKNITFDFIFDDEAVMLTGIVAIFMIFLSGALKTYDVPVWFIPTAAASVLITLLISPSVASVVGLVVSIFLAILFYFSISAFSVSFFGSIVGIFSAIKVKNRQDLVKVGYYIIFTNVIVIVSIGLLEGWKANIFLSSILWGAGNGVFSVMIVSAFLPYLERFFYKTTSIRLLELGDFNQPLLKRLMLEAPGSYHHSLMVASLAETAAAVVDANPLLCRVGAYYHDIGKIATPEYFIENQSAVISKHEDLQSRMSSFIVISHVKEGVRLANEYGIDKVVVDIIQQHHGTSLVYYFYMKALQNGTADAEKSVYRYSGPRPRTKESAIIMLADSVEAASRTLEEPSFSHLQEMVYKIINNKFTDGQFDETELKLADLHKIAEKFVSVLMGIYHSRIKYPEEVEKK